MFGRLVWPLIQGPSETSAPVVPLSECDLAPRVEGDDVENVDFIRFDPICDPSHLFEEVRGQSLNGSMELFGDLTDLRPVEFAVQLEQFAVNIQLPVDLFS